jgi:hypothetical protein
MNSRSLRPYAMARTSSGDQAPQGAQAEQIASATPLNRSDYDARSVVEQSATYLRINTVGRLQFVRSNWS